MLERVAYAEIDRIAASSISSAEKFALLYEKRLWQAVAPGINRGRSQSGFGSTMEATCLIRPALETFLREMEVQTLFDAPCGDYHWMRHLAFDGTYIGGDIVRSVVTNLNQAFRGSPEFIDFDITRDEFPKADAWLCRACMQHLSNAEITQAIDNFRRSRVKLALLSNSRLTSNYDIKSGGSRMVDLTRSPFNLPRPHWMLPDNPCGESRHVGVWYREDL
jgi:hypothetical protein